MSINEKRDEFMRRVNIMLGAAVGIVIIIVLLTYTYAQRVNVINNVENITNQIAEYIASDVANEVSYAQSSIKLSSVSMAQMMTSDTLENPSGIIEPMIANTPFGGIEYIRPDGMNVMNIGEPFDASDRVYYTEGIKGNTGIWNNYHPKTSKDTLIDFYTPLIYNEKISGVITGYIEANSQLAPLFKTSLLGEEIYGLLLDENNMVICQTMESEYVKDLTLDMFMDSVGASDEQKQSVYENVSQASDRASTSKDSNGDERICVTLIPGTQWRVVIIIPDESFKAIVADNTRNAVIAVVIISILLMAYASYMLLRNARRRKLLSAEKEKLQIENTEIHDIIASANMGTWRIELVDGENPRMYADNTMKMLLGIGDEASTPEETYTEWFSKILPEAVPSVLQSVERMQKGYFDENTYLWEHPTKGTRYVRCGGTSQKIKGGILLRGYHYDVDDVVREDLAKVEMLREALNEKNEYYSTLGTLESVFYSMHVLNLVEDTVVEFNSKNQVKAIVNNEHGAVEMMVKVMNATVEDDYREDALEFTNLTTLAERMKNKKIISKQFVGKNLGWFLVSFITMEKDKEGRPVKVICTTRSIDEEKKQEERLIRKTQTDELTGVLNRRAYEDDIYEHNDTPQEDDFIYISLDVNGLKVVNDTLGHLAGDELIIGACQCMKRSFGAYGRIYRVGGDEFVAIIFCDSKKLVKVIEDFADTIENWSGKLVESLSISYGYVSREEMPELSVRQLGTVAEERMYEAKAEHYRKAGVDRRGQRDAHKALCDLYTKILKIDITNDTYEIVGMDETEKNTEKGFAESISKWLTSFGRSGQVHPDDLEEFLKYTDLEYMKTYFAGDKTSLHIFYRRKFNDEYKQAMMEIIPANDYSNDSQTLFLYVKNIDK